MSEFSHAFGELNSLIREAAYTSDAIDYFDLNSDDPAMQDTWKWFLSQHRESVLALVKHIVANEAEIIAALGQRDPSTPCDPPRATLSASQLADWVYVAITHYAIIAERATTNPELNTPDPNKLPFPAIRRWQRGIQKD